MIKHFSLILLLCAFCFATEPLKPVYGPQTSVALGALAELRDDVYSADIYWGIELAPCKCFSIYTDMSYRLVSIEFDTMLHDQIHEALNLQVNGLNESFLGAKFFPLDYAGVAVNWRFQPKDGSRIERFQRLGIEPMGLYPFSRNMLLGISGQYYTFLEDRNFQPGDELGLKGSFIWNLFWNRHEQTGWQVAYVFMFRWRIQESENHNLDREYQKMDDMYRGFRMRGDISRQFAWIKYPLSLGMGYEMNRGNLFGFETGHRVDFYIKAKL